MTLLSVNIDRCAFDSIGSILLLDCLHVVFVYWSINKELFDQQYITNAQVKALLYLICRYIIYNNIQCNQLILSFDSTLINNKTNQSVTHIQVLDIINNNGITHQQFKYEQTSDKHVYTGSINNNDINKLYNNILIKTRNVKRK